jgi:hypothetical protein
MGEGYNAKTQALEGTGHNPSPGVTSSGRYQFTDPTWKATVRKFAPEMADKSDDEIMALKSKDDSFKDKMFNEYTHDNKNQLTQNLGHAPSDAEVYLAHQQGVTGAERLINNPTANAAALVGLDHIKNNLPTSMRAQAETMTAGDFVSHWGDAYEKAAPGGGPHPNSFVGGLNQQYAKNDSGSRLTYPDFLASHTYEDTQQLRDFAQQIRPGDMKFSNAIVARNNQVREQLVSDQKNTYHQGVASVMGFVTGEDNNGKIPATVNELYSDPTMARTLNMLAGADKDSQEFVLHLPDTISRLQKADTADYSRNGYDAAIRTLTSSDTSNGIVNQSQLDKMVGSAGLDAINGKDYGLNKTVLNQIAPDTGSRVSILKNMQDIKNLGGDADGQGYKRAMLYLETMSKLTKPDINGKVPTGEQLKDMIEGNAAAPYFNPSRAAQIKSVMQSAQDGTIPTFNSKNDPGFAGYKGKFMTADGDIMEKQ